MSPSDLTLPPIHPPKPDNDIFLLPKPEYPVDWLDFTRTRSAHSIAEKTCEMICYLWFSSPSRSRSNHRPPYPSPNNSPSSSPPTTTLQLVATSTFVQFLQKLLETTQVSQSVIVLSLHYIFRLKERNRFTPAQSGSEFRIAVAALMMANKFLDDNTYTNKTWSEVSGIDLEEINRMEREFLLGVDFNLYVDKPTYESWLNLLKGLVSAKERDCQRFRKTRRSLAPGPSSSMSPRYKMGLGLGTTRARSTSPSSKPVSSYHSTTYVQRQRQREQEQAYPTPATSTSSNCPSPTPRPGSKRNAAVAFSPTSASFSHLPAKRPLSEYTANTTYSSSSTFTPSSSTNNNTFTPSSVSTTPSRAPQPQRPGLQIPEYRSNGSAPNSYSPLEGLQSFVEKMSIGASPGFGVPHSSSSTQPPHSYPSQTQIPTTLIAAYAHDEQRRSAAVPQNLYFYTLACSPVEEREVCLPLDGGEAEQEGRVTRNSKTRLRYHQPQPSSSSTAGGRHAGVGYGDEYPSAASAFTAASRDRGVSYGDVRMGAGAGYRFPQAVQSASTSPNDLDVRRVGRRIGVPQRQQGQQYSPQKSFTQQRYSPGYHSHSQQASPQYHQPPPPTTTIVQHHTQQRVQQGTCSHHSSPLYRPLGSSQSQYHQASSRGTSPQPLYHHHHQPPPPPQQQQRHSSSSSSSRQIQQSQGLPRFHDNVWNTQPAVVAPPPPSHSFPLEEEEEEVMTARQEVFAPAPKYALPVSLHAGDEVEMDGEEDDDEMEEEGDDEEMEEDGDDGEREWSHQQQRQRHDPTTATYPPNHSNESTGYEHHHHKATAATFANAGPPGVCFYPTPSLSAYTYPPYAAGRQYSSGRRW